MRRRFNNKNKITTIETVDNNLSDEEIEHFFYFTKEQIIKMPTKFSFVRVLNPLDQEYFIKKMIKLLLKNTSNRLRCKEIISSGKIPLSVWKSIMNVISSYLLCSYTLQNQKGEIIEIYKSKIYNDKTINNCVNILYNDDIGCLSVI